MELKVLSFGIAKDIIGDRMSSIYLEGTDASLADVRRHLLEEYPEFKSLTSLKFAVKEEYRADDFRLQDGEEVVLIPPVAGG